MIKYKFDKQGIKKMYHDTLEECYKALGNGTINEMHIEIKMGNQVMKVPMNADYFEDIFGQLKEWAEEDC